MCRKIIAGIGSRASVCDRSTKATTAIVMLTTAPKRQIRTKVRRTEKAARPQRYAGQAQTVSIDRKIYGLNQ
jgi:hypothetical protein